MHNKQDKGFEYGRVKIRHSYYTITIIHNIRLSNIYSVTMKAYVGGKKCNIIQYKGYKNRVSFNHEATLYNVEMISELMEE
jgi:hypothetical protein